MARMGVVAGLFVMLAVAGCASIRGGAVRASTYKAKILLKKDGANCVSRTVPKHIDFEKGEYDSFIWTVRDTGNNCLPSGVEVELRFTAGNPTTCTTLITSGNPKKIECDLGTTYTPNTPYKYDVYLVGTGHPTGGTRVEDPDIEIVVF